MKKWLQAMGRVLLFQKELCVVGAGLSLAAYAAGMILHAVLAAWAGEMTTGIPLGSIMVLIALVVLCPWDGALVLGNYNYALAMGQTRRKMIPAYMLAQLLVFLGFGIAAWLLYLIEQRLLAVWYPAARIEAIVVPLYVPFLFAFGAAALAMLFAAAVTRFGQVAFVVICLVCTLSGQGCLRLYELLAAYRGKNALVKFLYQVCASFLQAMPSTAVLLILGVSVVCFAAVYLLLRRQQVRV